MKLARNHWELERSQIEEELEIIERERVLEDIMLRMKRHQISVDELQHSIHFSSMLKQQDGDRW